MKNVKVKVENIEQAMQYKAILQAFGEKITENGVFWADKSCNTLVCDYISGQWFCESEVFVGLDREEITIAKLVEMLAAPKPQAIKVNNKVEFATLMRHYESKGWKTIAGTDPLKLEYSVNHPYVLYQDKFLKSDIPLGREVRSFESLNLKAPDLIAEDGMPLWFGDTWFGVYYDQIKGWYTIGRGSFTLWKDISAIVEPNKMRKIFSTKNAALEWESAHKKVMLSEDGFALAYGDTYVAVGDSICGWIIIGNYVLATDSGIFKYPKQYKAFKQKCNAETWIASQKSVLLTTVDGVPLREGDQYYRVVNGGGTWRIASLVPYLKKTHKCVEEPELTKAFNFKAKAEEWIAERNKPVYPVGYSLDSAKNGMWSWSMTKEEIDQLYSVFDMVPVYEISKPLKNGYATIRKDSIDIYTKGVKKSVATLSSEELNEIYKLLNK